MMRRSSDIGAMAIAVLIIGTILGVVVGALFLFNSYVCSSRWEKSGFATSWGPIQGCLIQHEGRWIPEENYRDMP